jgi:hypothetical protein
MEDPIVSTLLSIYLSIYLFWFVFSTNDIFNFVLPLVLCVEGSFKEAFFQTWACIYSGSLVVLFEQQWP